MSWVLNNDGEPGVSQILERVAAGQGSRVSRIPVFGAVGGDEGRLEVPQDSKCPDRPRQAPEHCLNNRLDHCERYFWTQLLGQQGLKLLMPQFDQGCFKAALGLRLSCLQ